MTKTHLSRPWTDEEIQKLIASSDAGMSKLRVASILRRSITSIETRARLLGKPFKTIYEAKKEMQAKEAAALLTLAR